MIRLLTFILALLPQLIPAPAEMQVRGGSFNLAPPSANKIEFRLDPDCGLPAEGYTLEVTRTRVKAVASTEAGLFYARQTLDQLTQNGRIPCVKITDYPRFAWRGFHIDPCRHFLSVEQIKEQIDILSSYKMNVMHWHLTDDQGWRIQIRKYPRLTQVGGTRTEFDGTVHQGYYTQAEIREVVAYAAQHHVTVVPEIEMPGHALAAIAAYPALSCTKESVQPQTTWGSPDIVLCPGSEFTFQFLSDVIDEVVALFPSEYIHIGGDECRKDKWEQCPDCQARIRALGLKADEAGTAEEKLQSYAIRRMEDILARRGRKLIGWDEILEGGLSPNATVMSWRGESGGIKAALAGHDVIMTPGKEGMYLDHVQGDPKVEPLSIGNYTTLEKAYGYDPVPEELTRNGKAQHVLGVQCNNWSEYIYTDEQRQYMLFPRAFAVAELAWTPLEKKDWESFRTRVDAACRRLDARGVNYHIPLPEQPGYSCDRLAFTDSKDVAFKTTRPMKMVYTLDGSEPTPASPEYKAPLHFIRDGLIRIASVTAYGKMSPVRTIEVKKMTPWPATSSPTNTSSPTRSGISAWRTDGRFITAADLEGASWREVSIGRLRDLNTLEAFDRNLPDSTRFYAAKARSAFRVKETGVYRFNSDCDQVWIDGRLVIDNGAQPKRFSHQDVEIALEGGTHSVEVLFIYNVLGGWNSLRGKTEVYVLPPGKEEWKAIELVK